MKMMIMMMMTCNIEEKYLNLWSLMPSHLLHKGPDCDLYFIVFVFVFVCVFVFVIVFIVFVDIFVKKEEI